MIGIYIVILLGFLFIDGCVKWSLLYDKKITYKKREDGTIREYIYRDCTITVPKIAQFYSSGIFQIVVKGEVLIPKFRQDSIFFIDVPLEDDGDSCELIVFRNKVLVVAGSQEMIVVPLNRKEKYFYGYLAIISSVLDIILANYIFK